MSQIILAIFATLTIVSGFMTYKGVGLQGVTSEDTTTTSRSYRSSSSSSWSGSSSGGFSSGK